MSGLSFPSKPGDVPWRRLRDWSAGGAVASRRVLLGRLGVVMTVIGDGEQSKHSGFWRQTGFRRRPGAGDDVS